MYDVDSKEWTTGDIVSFGTLTDCDVFLNVWSVPVQFAIFEGNRGERIVVDFSRLLSFGLSHQAAVSPWIDSERRQHLRVRWLDLNLELDFGREFQHEDDKVNVFTLVPQLEMVKAQVGSLITIPSRSIVRLQAIGSKRSKNLILALP